MRFAPMRLAKASTLAASVVEAYGCRSDELPPMRMLPTPIFLTMALYDVGEPLNQATPLLLAAMIELISSERPRKSLGMVRRSWVESRVMLRFAVDCAARGVINTVAMLSCHRTKRHGREEPGRWVILCIRFSLSCSDWIRLRYE